MITKRNKIKMLKYCRTVNLNNEEMYHVQMSFPYFIETNFFLYMNIKKSDTKMYKMVWFCLLKKKSQNIVLQRIYTKLYHHIIYFILTLVICFAESSQGKYGGCFSAESTVMTNTGSRRKLQDLRIGEKVLSLDLNTQQFVYSEVILFLDWDPSQRRDFLRFELQSGRTLTVTPTHLLFQLANDNTSRTIFAAKLYAGDRVLVRNSGYLVEDTVVKVQQVIKTGVFAPLTTTGTVVVDDIVASCYATIDSQLIAQWAFAPIRLMFNFKNGLYRMWTLIHKPVQSWTVQSNDISAMPSRGVYWYANILYVIGDYLIPSHIYK